MHSRRGSMLEKKKDISRLPGKPFIQHLKQDHSSGKYN